MVTINKKKHRILVIGGTGMLGHMVYMHLKSFPGYAVFNTVYRTKLTESSIFCDVTNQYQLESLFHVVNPTVVINCVGALVQQSKEYPISAIKLNSLLPHMLKNMCDGISAKLIHISTDCVFSGQEGYYLDDSFRDADDFYGRSKALGEINSPYHCTLRTSIIGPELKTDGTGLFNWFMKSKGKVNGYKNVYWSGTTTLELSQIIDLTIKKDLTGLHNISNNEAISKFALLQIIKEIFVKDIIIQPKETHEVNKSLTCSVADIVKVNHYKEMISDLKIFMLKNNQYYKQYGF